MTYHIVELVRPQCQLEGEMKILQEKEKKNSAIRCDCIKMIFVLIITVLISATIGGCEAMDKGTRDSIRCISFSPDGKKILFDRKKNNKPYIIYKYDTETGELSAYQSPAGERWGQARYSYDGKRIVFMEMPLIGNNEDPANWQIAVMDSDGKNVRKISNTVGFKIYPSFSHNGKKIIFARADKIRKRGATPAGDYDVYDVDVETGQETRLTYFKFFQISGPYYFPDDKTFIFWGESPFSYPAIPGSDRNPAIMKEINKELQAKYKYNSIYVMQGHEKKLVPCLVMPDYQKMT